MSRDGWGSRAAPGSVETRSEPISSPEQVDSFALGERADFDHLRAAQIRPDKHRQQTEEGSHQAMRSTGPPEGGEDRDARGRSGHCGFGSAVFGSIRPVGSFIDPFS